MKFAVITDIHGNAPALKAVLEEIDRTENIKQIFCLGDLIGIGPDSNEVLEMLFARKDISIVTGNHDEAVLALVNGKTYPKSHAMVRKHHEWIAEKLDTYYIEKLSSLPRRIMDTFNGIHIYFSHYRILPGRMDAHISEDPFHSIVDPSIENMEKLFKYFKEDLICFGHHHPLHYFQGAITTYLNPGALGCHHKSTARYAIVSIAEGNLNVQLKEASYDNTQFLQSYEKLQIPDREIIIKIFHGNQKF